MGGYVAFAIGRELGALSNGGYVTLASRIHIIRWRTIMGMCHRRESGGRNSTKEEVPDRWAAGERIKFRRLVLTYSSQRDRSTEGASDGILFAFLTRQLLLAKQKWPVVATTL